jgi:hypothetical protein
VAIPLRENVPICFEFGLAYVLEFWLENSPQSRPPEALQNGLQVIEIANT